MQDSATTQPTSIDTPITQPNGRISVLLVDDHPAVRDALRSVIEDAKNIEVRGEANSSEDALRAINRHPPDLAILDISLKEGHGLDLVQTLQSEAPEISTVVFSMYDEEIYAERAIRAGASGYLMKSEPVEKIVDAIQTVADGDLYLSRHMSTKFLNKVIKRDDSTSNRAVDVLTDREMQVFQMLGEGQSIQEITERLTLARKTIETYRRQAKEKLGFDSVGELLQFAVQWRHHHGTDRRSPNRLPRNVKDRESQSPAVSTSRGPHAENGEASRAHHS